MRERGGDACWPSRWCVACMAAWFPAVVGHRTGSRGPSPGCPGRFLPFDPFVCGIYRGSHRVVHRPAQGVFNGFYVGVRSRGVIQPPFVRVVLTTALRLLFSADGVRRFQSLAKRRPPPNPAYGGFDKPAFGPPLPSALWFSGAIEAPPNGSSTHATVVPPYAGSPHTASTDASFSPTRSPTCHPRPVSAPGAAWTWPARLGSNVSVAIGRLRPLIFPPPRLDADGPMGS